MGPWEHNNDRSSFLERPEAGTCSGTAVIIACLVVWPPYVHGSSKNQRSSQDRGHFHVPVFKVQNLVTVIRLDCALNGILVHVCLLHSPMHGPWHNCRPLLK